jgi:prefoldin subunit 5
MEDERQRRLLESRLDRLEQQIDRLLDTVNQLIDELQKIRAAKPEGGRPRPLWR